MAGVESFLFSLSENPKKENDAIPSKWEPTQFVETPSHHCHVTDCKTFNLVFLRVISIVGKDRIHKVR